MSEYLILVADDATPNLAPTCDALRGLGYRVLATANVETALARAGTHLPEAVVVDLTHPSVDGLSVCQRLRQNPVTTAVPLLALTPAADSALRQAALEAGADELLTHPLDWVEIQARLRSLRAAQPHHGGLFVHASASRQAETVGVADLLAHDLKSPLSIIVGALELLVYTDRKSDPAVVTRLVGGALEATRRQMRMIDELIDLSRLEVGALEWKREVVSLADVANEALVEAADAIGAKRLRLDVRVPPDLPAVTADRNLLRRVLLSLIDNALKFTVHEDTVYVEGHVSNDGAFCALVMTDAGRPVLPAYADAIFERAIQWRARREGSRTSVALGLPFCRAVLRLMGGDILVRSVQSPSGDVERTAFTITLPVHR